MLGSTGNSPVGSLIMSIARERALCARRTRQDEVRRGVGGTVPGAELKAQKQGTANSRLLYMVGGGRGGRKERGGPCTRPASRLPSLALGTQNWGAKARHREVAWWCIR